MTPPTRSTNAAERISTGSLPPDNEPGHHPESEQDKPIGRRPKPAGTDDARATSSGAERFHCEYDGIVGFASKAFSGGRAWIDVDDEQIVARFGLWTVRTPRSNIASVTVTGPYAAWKVAGPPHISFADRGLTFATNDRRGVCIAFHEPIAGIEPTGRIRHPGLTITVADPEHLARVLES